MYSTRRWKISACRASSHTWRAMSSWNSHGASGKSNSVRPAASSSKGRLLLRSSPCSSRISRTCRERISTKLSGRASLSTGIHRCIAKLSWGRSVGRALAHPLDKPIDFLFGEAGEQPRLARDRQRRIDFDILFAEALLYLPGVFLARASAAEVEKVVDIL